MARAVFYAQHVHDQAQQSVHQWQEYKDTDSFAGKDAEYLRTTNLNECKKICQEKQYGGFVYYQGFAYFRRRSAKELRDNRVFARNSILHVCPEPIPVVTAILLDPASPQQATQASPAASESAATPSGAAAAAPTQPPQPPAPPAIPKEACPPRPATLVTELSKLTEDELRNMKANRQSVDDWILEHALAHDLTVKALDVREANCKLASDILAREAELGGAAAECEAAREGLLRRREAVEALHGRHEEIRKQHSPEHVGQILAAKAQQADAEAEEALQEALDAPGPMDASALAAFRQRYMKQKQEKHCMLAVKERLEAARAA